MLENVQIVFHKQPKFKMTAAQCTQKNRKHKKTAASSRSSPLGAFRAKRPQRRRAKSKEKQLFSQVNIMMTDFSCFWVVIIANSGSLGPVNGDLLYSFLLYVLHAFRIYAPVSSQGAPPREPRGHYWSRVRISKTWRYIPTKNSQEYAPRRFRGGPVYFKIHFRVIFQRKWDFLPRL